MCSRNVFLKGFSTEEFEITISIRAVTAYYYYTVTGNKCYLLLKVSTNRKLILLLVVKRFEISKIFFYNCIFMKVTE